MHLFYEWLQQLLSTGIGNIINAVLWTVVYILVIRQGIRDKTYAMPFAAMCANAGWEFVYTVVFPDNALPQRVVNTVWLLFDGGIIWVYIRYGREEFRRYAPRSLFLPSLLLGLFVSITLHIAVYKQFAELGIVYSAFGINLLMSILFINFALTRKSLAGQSLVIAMCKLLGTAGASLNFWYHYPDNALLNTLYIMIFAFDVAYVGILYVMSRRSV